MTLGHAMYVEAALLIGNQMRRSVRVQRWWSRKLCSSRHVVDNSCSVHNAQGPLAAQKVERVKRRSIMAIFQRVRTSSFGLSGTDFIVINPNDGEQGKEMAPHNTVVVEHWFALLQQRFKGSRDTHSVMVEERKKTQTKVTPPCEIHAIHTSALLIFSCYAPFSFCPPQADTTQLVHSECGEVSCVSVAKHA